MKSLYEKPSVDIIELYYETDVIRTSVTDLDEDYNDTYVEDPWGDLLEDEGEE